MAKLADGMASALWYNPRTGRWWGEEGEEGTQQIFATAIPSGQGAPIHHFFPPGQPANGNDWVLVLEVTAG
jgi:hypothetical protein